MAVAFNRQEFKITETTVDATVPDNDTARLMYYLNSICSVLQLEVTDYSIKRLRDYEKYYMLTRDEEKDLLRLCVLISPEKLEGQCIFHSEEVCGVGASNRFFRVDSTETGFVASQSVFVGAVKVSVTKFMVYKTKWVNRNYIDPMNRITRVVNNTTKNNDEWIYTSKSESLDCCAIQ